MQGLSCRLFNSIDEVDPADWERVQFASTEPIFMDRRFIGAVEASMRQSCSFWHAIIYDEETLPIGCACLSASTIDLANLAHPRFASIVKRLSRMMPWLRYARVLTCGLPVSTGKSSLTLASRPRSRQLLSTLDEAVSELAAEARMDAVVYKEFGADDLDWTKSLLDRGYRCVATPPMHCLAPSFRDFQHYSMALRSHYRYKINRSIRKLRLADVHISIRRDPEEILKAYTPAVHSLYYQVLERSNTRLETLPIEFFHELTVRLAGQIDLMLLSKDKEVLAFGWSLRAASTYHMLFAGLNYELNARLDLYFNLMYAWLDSALRTGAPNVELGQTADAFKARLGCYRRPLYAFVKGLGPLRSAIVRFGADLMVARAPTVAEHNVFKRGPNDAAPWDVPDSKAN
jgi:predicted N-acyltransferase